MMMINSTEEHSGKLENEIKSDIELLKEINTKLNSIHDKLLIIQSDEDDTEVEILLEDLDNLFNSIKYYDV